MFIESVMPSNQFILCRPFLLLPSIFPSIRVFSNESLLRIRWPKYWSFSVSPSNEYSGLISFRMDWFVLLAVQRTLKSFLQHYIFFFCHFIYIFSWRIVALQNFVVFYQTSTKISHRYTHIPSLPNQTSLPVPSPPHLYRLSQSSCLCSLSHTANSQWLSILQMVL